MMVFCYYSTYLFSKDLLLKHSWKGRHLVFLGQRDSTTKSWPRYMPWRHCTHHLNFLNQPNSEVGNTWRSTFGTYLGCAFPGKRHVLGIICSNLMVFWWLLEMWSSEAWFRVKWNEVPPNNCNTLVHFCSQTWSNHFCHTSGNLYISP